VTALRRAARALAEVDPRDTFTFGGLALMGAGLACYSWALALTVVGAVLTTIGLVGAWRR
jgi:hypothetical protein